MCATSLPPSAIAQVASSFPNTKQQDALLEECLQGGCERDKAKEIIEELSTNFGNCHEDEEQRAEVHDVTTELSEEERAEMVKLLLRTVDTSMAHASAYHYEIAQFFPAETAVEKVKDAEEEHVV